MPTWLGPWVPSLKISCHINVKLYLNMPVSSQWAFNKISRWNRIWQKRRKVQWRWSSLKVKPAASMHISKICVPPRGSSPCFLLPPVQGAPLCNSGVRNLRGLKLPSDQQWQWIRNKVHSKCKELESSPNHLSPPPPPHPPPNYSLLIDSLTKL